MLYFPLSVCVHTGMTSQLFSIIWWFRAWKPCIFWKHIILAISVHEPNPQGPCRPTPWPLGTLQAYRLTAWNRGSELMISSQTFLGQFVLVNLRTLFVHCCPPPPCCWPHWCHSQPCYCQPPWCGHQAVTKWSPHFPKIFCTIKKLQKTWLCIKLLSTQNNVVFLLVVKLQ